MNDGGCEVSENSMARQSDYVSLAKELMLRIVERRRTLSEEQKLTGRMAILSRIGQRKI